MNDVMPITAPAPPVRRRWPGALAILVGLAAALAGVWWYLNWAEERDFQAALAETDQLDPGWRLEDILAARPAIPDERNSARHVAKVGPAVRGFWLGEKLETQLWKRPLNVRLHALEGETLRKRLEPLRAARDEAHKLKDMPDGRHDGDYDPVALTTSFQWVQDVRGFANFLRADTLLRSHQGDGADIAGACRAQINVARSIGDEPTLIALLVRIAIMELALADMEPVLALHELPLDELRALQALLEREIDEPRLLTAMRGERAIFGNFVDRSVQMPPVKGVGWRDWLTGWLVRVRRVDRPAYLRTMNELVNASKLPVEQQLDELARMEKGWAQQSASVATQLPGCSKVCGAHIRGQARLRCAMVAIACECYRQEQGIWPARLEALVQTSHLKAVPLDPYDGKSLRLRRLATGLLVYSVGVDRIDNGGNVDRDRPTAPGTDIGFQLWDVPFRGLPAPAPPPEEGDVDR